MRELVVYGGYLFVDGKQCRVVVATGTKKRAREILGVSASEFRSYWPATRNDREVEIALSSPETAFCCEDKYAKLPEFKRLEV